MAIDFKPLNDIRCEVGEGPVWDGRRNALFYADILGKTLHFVDLGSGGHRQWTFPSEVASLGLAESGRVVLALRHVVGLFDPADESFAEIAWIEKEQGHTTRLNDGKVGPDGAFWVGSMDDRPGEKKPMGVLYRVTSDGTVERKVDGLIITNGLAWTADGRTMFHTDTRGPWIDRWDFDPATGAIGNRTRIAEPDAATGRPDGGATDAEGFYWSAGISAQRLNRWSRDGRLAESFPVPVAAPTMPCFGGPDMKTLFVTSLREGRAPAMLDRYPLTGITMVGRSPVAGAPVARFRDR